MRVSINGLPHLEQGGRMLSTNLYFGTSAMALNSTALMPVEKRVNSTPATTKQRWRALRQRRPTGTRQPQETRLTSGLPRVMERPSLSRYRRRARQHLNHVPSAHYLVYGKPPSAFASRDAGIGHRSNNFSWPRDRSLSRCPDRVSAPTG